MLATPQPGRPSREKLIEFGNAAILTGPLFVTLTNLSTGTHIDLNASGPSQFSFSGDVLTTVILGSSVELLPPNVAAAAGVPPLSLLNGRLVLTLDLATGNVTSATFSGTAQDLCPLLQ